MSAVWLVVVVACVVWYSTITVYVAIRGASDIREMLQRLRDGQIEEDRIKSRNSRT